MISMQRSLSSPVRIHSSPLSPAVANGTPRSPTPTPESNHVEVVPRSVARRHRSRSPSRAEMTVSLPVRRSEDAPRRASLQQPPPPPSQPSQPPNSAATRKPIIAQTAVLSAPATPLSSKNANSHAHAHANMNANAATAALPAEPAPAAAATDKSGGRPLPLPLPLLHDVSLYTNPQFSPETDSTTLEELAHLVRLSKYQERKRANTRIRLQRSLVSTALSARLTRCGEIARRNLVDCFRADDKKNFATLYNAIHDVRKSCDELRRYALLEPEMETLQSPGLASSESLESPANVPVGAGALGSIAPFLHDLSATSRDAFLHFLTQIRSNPDYLARRICSLAPAELNALTSFHQGLEPIDSVLPYHSSRGAARGRSAAPAANRLSAHVPSPIEHLLSFQRHDPLSALIHTCFANSAGPDTAEDRRRTEIWATACARLIAEAKSGSEPILVSILNVWTAMRDWSGKSSMEWYLMKILEDGAFLLDQAEDQYGTRFNNLSDWTQKDHIRADEFYERAVNELFELVDDEDMTGIPEGLLELGNEILRHLEPKFVDSTRKWLIYKWLFSVFLLGVIIFPESYGMMAEYHITEYGRQKILKQVALKAQQHVIDATWSKKTVSIPPKIKGHVDSILNRFRGSRARKPAARLLPARSITSLRETVEVRPYLVISPADLVTLVNALHPERRPQSARSGSFRSGAPSISGLSSISQPLSSRNNFDTASIISTSASSVISDATTSRDMEDHRTGTPAHRYSPPVHETLAQKRMSNYEDDGIRLRLAIHEMTQVLGYDASHGSCHPCAERWAVLFISSDGNCLSTSMTYDPDDDPDEEENSSTSDTDEDDIDDGPELDKDYHQLRDSILKLVEDYEIPETMATDGNKPQLSNRATGIKKYRSKNKIITAERTPNRNPYRNRLGGDGEAKTTKDRTPDRIINSARELQRAAEDEAQAPPVLIAMLTAASAQSHAQSDFVSAHLYWKTLQQLNTLTSESLRRNGFAILLNIFSHGPRDSLRRAAAAIEEYDAWLVWLKQSQERHEGLIDGMTKRLRALRDKMWYVTDVRVSAPYEYSRNICVALKTMGMPQRWGSFQRTRQQLARGPAANYLHRTEEQIMDLLAASEGQGGPNKLSDDQADKTSQWLQQVGVENFCKGEERIHRFSLEVEACIGKLLGQNIVDGPVLWSSELYARDRRMLESTKASRDRDHSWGADDAASIISDPDRRYNSSNRPNSIIRDLRAMSAHNSSQQSFDSRYSFSRASTAMSDHLDGPDYFGVSSPVHTIDSTTTFWSPFHSASSATSRAHSPTTSLTNLSGSFSHHPHAQSHSSTGRPGTSASSNETVFQQRLSEEKSRFLSELRQTLTSLLLSDLGNLVFAKGSETDAWFGELGQECIDRRDALERRARKTTPKKSAGKPRVIEKKKSFTNLRGAGESVDRGSEGTETPTGPGNESSATSDTLSGRKSTVKDTTPEFPFKKAYQRLLRMFSVHPNPYTKINALHELEQLIIASMMSSGSRRAKLGWTRSTFDTAADETGMGSRLNPLENAIDNVKERRSHAIQQVPILSPTGPGPQASRTMSSDARSVASTGAGSTDAIANVLRALFRDASIRPKTLFRDLQYIAAFVPPSILDNTERGKAFWDTGLAALGLKQEVCRTMIEVADEVVGIYTHTRKKPTTPPPSVGSSSGSVGPEPGDRQISSLALAQSGSPSPPTTKSYTLADAGRMWIITAKEGDPTAQRELALFYLSNPELVERTTVPLAKPREVFKQAVMDKYGGSSTARAGVGSRLYHGHHAHPGDRRSVGSGGGGGGGGGLGIGIAGAAATVGGLASGVGGVGSSAAPHASSDLHAGAGKEGGDVRSDPALMCVAVHWMEAAERGGDELAGSFLRQENELVGRG